MNRSFKHLEKAYLLEIVVEFHVATSAILFATSDDPATFTKDASNRLQAFVQQDPDEQPCTGREDGRI